MNTTIIITYGPDGYQADAENGNIISTTEIPLEVPIMPDPTELAQAARDAVAGMSPTSGSRRAIEALADAIAPSVNLLLEDS